jgi:hypothetical protein
MSYLNSIIASDALVFMRYLVLTYLLLRNIFNPTQIPQLEFVNTGTVKVNDQTIDVIMKKKRSIPVILGLLKKFEHQKDAGILPGKALQEGLLCTVLPIRHGDFLVFYCEEIIP